LKLFTFLEAAEYPLTTFVYGSREYSARFSVAATSRILKPDTIVVFATEQAQQSVLAEFSHSISAETPVDVIPIPPGRDRSELLLIARRVFAAAQEETDLAFDLSYGPLTYPLLGLLVAILLRTRSEIRLRAILFAAYGIDQAAEDKTPLFDLAGMLTWMQWGNAVDEFNRTADSRELADLVRDQRRILARQAQGDQTRLAELGSLGKLAGVIEAIDQALHMIRPHQAMQHIGDLPDRLAAAKSLLEQGYPGLSLTALLESVVERYSRMGLYSPGLAENALEALRVERIMLNWYADGGGWVQSATLAREWLVSWVMVNLGQKQVTQLPKRQRVESVLAAEAADYLVARQSRLPYQPIFLQSLPRLEDVLALWIDLVDVRNDINHAGMREAPGKPDALKARIQKCIKVIESLEI
jgi:hypothetical protein